jgi:hypothetical protein
MWEAKRDLGSLQCRSFPPFSCKSNL